MSKNSTLTDNVIIRFAEVLQIEDNLDTSSRNEISKNSFGRRIKVRLIDDEENLNANDLPWVFPLLPKHLQIIPKIGEMVMVILQDQNSPNGNRFYIGPIVSQDYYLEHGGRYESLSLLQGVSTNPLVHPNGNPKNKGSYPDSDIIALQGRGDSAVWLKNEELRLLCGHKPNWANKPTEERLDPETLEFNSKNLSYIQMKYGKFIEKNSGKNFNSVINVVADRINLITHEGVDKSSNINVTDNEELTTNESIENIASNAQKMVYGNELVDFLTKFREVFAEHTHHWANDKQVFCAKDQEFWNKDLNELLSNTISIV